MFNYDQAMKHWRNHRKDRFYQQCSGFVSENPYSDTVSKETEEKLSRKSMQNILQSKLEYPIYLFQNKLGMWEIVPHNHIARRKIESMKELRKFANEYVFIDE